jgi:hypothetical protein
MTWTQSHYIEVAYGGASPVEPNAIECEYLAYLLLSKDKFKKKNVILKRDIMQLFSANSK